MLRRNLAIFLVMPLMGCGASGPNPKTTPPGPPSTAISAAAAGSASKEASTTKQLDADTPMKTGSGAAFEAPKGWFVTTRGSVIVLDDPERDLSLFLVEVKGEADAGKAIEASWRKVKPDFSRTIKQTTTPPAKDGWDSITQTIYEVGGTEQRTVMALAQRKGDTQYVALIDGANAGLDRRGAQLMTIISTFRAAGVEEESFKGKTARSLDAVNLGKLEAFVEEALAKTKVPGAAIAVVQGGKVVYEKGFGTRELGKNAPVSPNTLFMIGSTTKSLTTLMMAKLVDEGKFTWETPVTDVLPSFALGDADVTKKVMMKHTVCGCAGLPRQDLEFFFEFAGATPEQRVSSMRAMKPTTGFGETFQYSNTMVATGGYVAAHAADPQKKLGPAYDAVMQSRVFGPLGMKSTTLDFGVAKSRDHAMPHDEDLKLEYGPIPLVDEEGVVSVRPAGAAWSSVHDMARYVMVELANGKNEKGERVFAEANLLKRREPQIKITDKMSYGLGLFVENDHGVKVVHHGGNNLGFTSDTFFLPDQGVGVVLLTNGGGSANVMRKTVRRRVLEILFDGNAEATKSLDFGLTRQREAASKELARISTQPEAEWSNKLVGTYVNSNLGKLVVRFDGKQGVVDAGEWKSTFGKQKSEDGTIKLVLLDRPWSGFAFLPGEKGGTKTLTLEMAQQTYVFEQVPAKP